MTNSGRLVVVGVGMTLGAHLSPICRSHIEQADMVFCSVSDPLVEQWVKEMSGEFINLQSLYREGKDRRQTYQQMIDTVIDALRSGKHVVAVFYGHPGVFAMAPHKMVSQAIAKGFAAHMEPSISAEDCLYADMGIDPGKVGCLHFETSQFMLYHHAIDPSAYLILWQIGLAGDVAAKQYTTDPRFRGLLVEQVAAHYPMEHQVALYEAPTLPIHEPRIEWLPLSELQQAEVFQHSTLVVPPATKLQRNNDMTDKIAALQQVIADEH